MRWDPDRYLAFAGPRFGPSLDLLRRIDHLAPASVWDLGCGTGDLTALLADRWPEAQVHGLDVSAEMLERARGHEGIAWVQGDLREWSPPEPVDLIFSTATLHWVDDHATVFARLVGFLAPGGVLAVQMPNNFGEPSHTLLYALARSPRWRDRLGHLVRPHPVAPPGWYHRALRPLVTTIEVWETTYQQALQGDDPVAAWTEGTAARPFLDALDPDEGDEFRTQYAALLREAYPTDPDGITLFPFTRLFVVARR